MKKEADSITWNNFGQVLVFLLSIYTVAAVSSQTLLDVAMVATALALIYEYFKKKNLILLRKIGIEWAFFCYLIVVVLGFVINGAPGVEWATSIIKFSWIINIYFLILAFRLVQLNLVSVVKILSSLTLIPSLYALFGYLRGFDLLTGRENTRLTGFVNSSTYHAHGNAIILVLLLGSLFFSFMKLDRFWKIFAPVSAALLALTVLLTFTRGIWLSLVVSSVFILALIEWKKLLRLALLGVAIFIIAVAVWPKFHDRITRSASLQANEERISLFLVNVQMWREFPWLGIGYGENQRRNREYWDRPEWHKPPGYITSHAHNQYLNVLATTGVFGLIFFISFFFFFLRKNIELLRKTNRKIEPRRYEVLMVCLWAQIEITLACLSDVSFEYAKIRALIILVWALVIAIEQKPSVVNEGVEIIPNP